MPQKSFLFFAFLFLLSCFGQMSSDIYLPALPAIQHVFHTHARNMQFSLAIFMLGFSISHLVYGPISDWTGRKKPLLIGMTVSIAGIVLCFFSTTVDWFILGRFLQGAGAGAGAALFLSILRDVYEGDQLAKISSFLAISRVLLLASSPLIGAYLLHHWNWQACFSFLFIYGVLCLIGTLTIYQETNRYAKKNHFPFHSIFKNIFLLFTHTQFISNAFCVMLAFGGILAWLTTLPFLLQNVVGLTPVQFGWVAAIAGLFFIVGGFLNAMMVERIGSQKLLIMGLWIMLAGSIVMLVYGLLHHVSMLSIMIPVVIYIVGSSFVFSNAYAGAMGSFTTIAGTAGALFGFLQILGGSLSSFLMSLAKTYNQIPLSIALMCSAVLALLILHSTRRINGSASASDRAV